MARSVRPDIEDAGPSAGHPAAGEVPASVQDSSRLMLEAWRLYAQWSKQAEIDHARTLDGLDGPLAAAVASVGKLHSWNELGEVSNALWRASFEEFRKHQSGLPYAWASVQLQIAKQLIASVADSMAPPESAVQAPVKPGRAQDAIDPGYEGVEQWMRQWAALWSFSSTPGK